MLKEEGAGRERASWGVGSQALGVEPCSDTDRESRKDLKGGTQQGRGRFQAHSWGKMTQNFFDFEMTPE